MKKYWAPVEPHLNKYKEGKLRLYGAGLKQTERYLMKKYLPFLWRQGGITRYFGWKCRIRWPKRRKIKTWFCLQTTTNPLASRSNMFCFTIGGMENQQHDFLESFGTTEEIISCTRLPLRTYSPFFYRFPLPLLSSELSFSFCSSQLAKSLSVKFWISRKIVLEIILSQNVI